MFLPPEIVTTFHHFGRGRNVGGKEAAGQTISDMIATGKLHMESRNSAFSNNLFAGSYLDRRAEERSRPDWLGLACADPDTAFLALQGTAALVSGDDSQVRLLFLRGEDPLVGTALACGAAASLLGWFRGVRCVLLELATDSSAAPLPPLTRFAELRPLAAVFPADEAALFAYARALTHWHATHRHCNRCAARLELTRAGHALRCAACAHEIFPRIDPAIIVLVSDGELALLGRQASWPPQRYSTIAGFMEPGESLEDAVRREVFEEAGITLQRIEYFASQPWPFPASLMLGFNAHALAGQQPLTHDGELEDARWFARDDLRAGRVLLPPRESISRRLIEHWLGADA
jgi:NAD+ diphosphatase